MMIEADVSLGKLKSDPHSENRPIMAHPPISASDLSLEDFLGMILIYKFHSFIKYNNSNKYKIACVNCRIATNTRN
jgi:hypothetical protein